MFFVQNICEFIDDDWYPLEGTLSHLLCAKGFGIAMFDHRKVDHLQHKPKKSHGDYNRPFSMNKTGWNLHIFFWVGHISRRLLGFPKGSSFFFLPDLRASWKLVQRLTQPIGRLITRNSHSAWRIFSHLSAERPWRRLSVSKLFIVMG